MPLARVNVSVSAHAFAYMCLQCSTKRGWGGVRANAGVNQCVCDSQPRSSVDLGVEGFDETVFAEK